MGGELIKVMQVVVGTPAGSKRSFPEGTYHSGDLLWKMQKDSLSLHDDVYEKVNSFQHGDEQRYVRPNNTGVGVEEGVGVRQVSIQ